MELSFSLGSLFDSGSYGQIYQAQYKSPLLASRNIAVKVLPLKPQNADILNREIRNWKAIPHHKNVLALEKVEYDYHNAYLVSEYCENGSLHDHLRSKTLYNEYQVKQMAKQVIQGIVHCHRHNIAHCDIKPANIVMTKDGMCKLCDFGNSVASLHEYEGLGQKSGTPMFVSPERMERSEFGSNSDVWAFGVVVYMLYCNGVYMPFRADLKEKKVFYNEGINFPSNMSKSAKDLISKCLVLNKKERPSSLDIYKHPFLS
jgi:serine/threonine protein kinase